MWRLFCGKDVHFLARYVAYHNLRSKGWVPKSGLKYGSDFGEFIESIGAGAMGSCCMNRVPTNRESQGKLKQNSKSGKIRYLKIWKKIRKFYFEMLRIVNMADCLDVVILP
jgi:hypothetical protein